MEAQNAHVDELEDQRRIVLPVANVDELVFGWGSFLRAGRDGVLNQLRHVPTTFQSLRWVEFQVFLDGRGGGPILAVHDYSDQIAHFFLDFVQLLFHGELFVGDLC